MRLVIFIIIFLHVVPAFAANKNKQNKEAVISWYSYSFTTQDGFRFPQYTLCAKSDLSPAETIVKLEKTGGRYKIIELATINDKLIATDIQTFITYSDRNTLYTDTVRFVKGEKLCNEFRDDDLSGKINKHILDRYK